LDGSGVTERKLGLWPAVSLDMAKTRAFFARRKLADNIEPWQEVEWNKDEFTTFKQLCAQWIKDQDLNHKQTREANVMLFKHCAALLDLQVHFISPQKIHDALAGLEKERPKRFREVRRKLELVFDMAEAKHLPLYRGKNPAQWKVLKSLFPRRK